MTGNISIMCSAHGIPAPSIRFSYRGTVLGETETALTSRVHLGDETTLMSMDDGMFTVRRVLTLFRASEQDVGIFTCEAFSAIQELGLLFQEVASSATMWHFEKSAWHFKKSLATVLAS